MYVCLFPFFFLFRHIFGQTISSEVPGGIRPFVHLIWTPITSTLTLPPDQRQSSWVFLVAVAGSDESVRLCYEAGLGLIDTGDLRPSHLRSWAELWKGSSIEVEGAESLNRALIGCMFYLLSSFSSLREGANAPLEFGGVSPGGLSNGNKEEDYHGHVFWDQVSLTQFICYSTGEVHKQSHLVFFLFNKIFIFL